MDYMILEDDDRISLSLEVMTYIEMGWTPQGGVSICTDGSCEYFAQAMIKEEN